MVETSIIIPMWNEEDWVERAYTKVKEAIKRYNLDAQLVFATDGCTDGTVDKINKLKEKDPSLIHFNDPNKLGRGKALTKVIKTLNTPYIVYMDSDLATDLRYLPILIEKLKEGADIATGSRLMKDSICERSFRRDAFSKVYNLLSRILFRSKLRDHQCGFKGFNRERILPILDQVKDTGWFWDTELLIRGQKMGLKIAEFPVEWRDRDAEASKVNVFKDAKEMGTALLKLRMELFPETIQQMIKFGMVGVLNTLVSLLTLIILDNTIGRGNYGYYIAYLVGGLNSFFLNRKYTFKQGKFSKRTPLQLVGFIITVFIAMWLYNATATYIEHDLNMHYILAAIGGAIVNFLFQFTISKIAIFRKRKSSPTST